MPEIQVPDSKTDELLQALTKEVVKVYRVYDGSDRLITEYETYSNTTDGGVALKTEYTYIGVTSRVEKMKESLSTWLTAYDI